MQKKQNLKAFIEKIKSLFLFKSDNQYYQIRYQFKKLFLEYIRIIKTNIHQMKKNIEHNQKQKYSLYNIFKKKKQTEIISQQYLSSFEKINQLFKKFLKDYKHPMLLIQKWVKSLNQKDQIILQEDFPLNQSIKILSQLNQYNLPKEIKNIILQLITITQNKIKQIQQIIKTKQYSKALQQLQNQYVGYLQIKSIALGIGWTKHASQVIQKKQQSIQKAKQLGLSIQRIGTQLVMTYQKYFMIYCMNKYIMEINIMPGLVIRINQYHFLNKSRNITTYFFIHQIDNKEPLQNFQLIQQQNESYKIVNNKNNVINPYDFVKHFFGMFITGYYQSCTYNYKGIPLTKSPNKFCDHAVIRSSLLFFSRFIKNYKFPIIQFIEMIFNKSYIKRYFEILQLIINNQWSNFKFKGQKCLNFTQNIVQQWFQAINSLTQIKNWLIQVIFPIKSYITLEQLFSNYFPILNYFSQKFNFKTLNQLDQQLIKIEPKTFLPSIPKQYLLPYLKKNKIFQSSSNKSTIQIMGNWTKKIDIKHIQNNEIQLIIIQFMSKYQFFLNENINTLFFDQIKKKWTNFLNKKILNHIQQIRKKIETQKSFIKSIVLQYIEQDEYYDVALQLLQLCLGIEQIGDFQLVKNIHYNTSQRIKFNRYLIYIKHKYANINNKIYYKTIFKKLIQKCLKYQKIDQCLCIIQLDPTINFNLKYLLQLNVNKQNYQFSKFLNLLQENNNDLYRTYLWQQTIKKSLKGKTNLQILTFKNNLVYINKLYIQRFFISKNNNKRKQENSNIIYMPLFKKKIYQINNVCISEAIKFPGYDYFLQIIIKACEMNFLKIHTELGFLNNKAILYFIQKIQEGLTLQQFSKVYGQIKIYQKINQQYLSELILFSIIFSPKCIPLSGIFLKKQNNKYKPLLIIIPTFSCNSIAISQGNYKLNNSNCLFMLKYMRDKIPLRLVEKWKKINPWKLSHSIFQQICGYQTMIFQILNNVKNKNQQFQLENSQRIYSGIPFQKNYSNQVTLRLMKIKQLIKEDMTHQQLLEKIDPILGTLYGLVNNYSKKQQSLQETYNNFNNLKKYSKQFVKENIINFYQSFIDRKIEQASKEFPFDLHKLNFIGPSNSLKNINKNQQMLDLSSLQQFHTKQQYNFFLENLRYLSLQNNKLIETYKKLGQISKKFIKNNYYQSFDTLYLINISQKQVQFQMNRINKIVIYNGIYSKEFIVNFGKLQCLTYLQLSDLSLSSISQSSKPLTFPLLKTFIIKNFPNITKLFLNCINLNNFCAINIPILKQLFIDSQNLKRIRLKGVNIKNYIIAWVLKGINIDWLQAQQQYQKQIDKLIIKIKKNQQTIDTLPLIMVLYRFKLYENTNIKDAWSLLNSIYANTPNLKKQLLCILLSLLSLNNNYKTLNYNNFYDNYKMLKGSSNKQITSKQISTSVDLFKMVLKGLIFGYKRKKTSYINRIILDSCELDEELIQLINVFLENGIFQDKIELSLANLKAQNVKQISKLKIQIQSKLQINFNHTPLNNMPLNQLLNLKHNKIKIKSLSLRGCLIQNIEVFQKQRFPFIKFVDLGQNLIERGFQHLINNCPIIQHLQIDQNPICLQGYIQLLTKLKQSQIKKLNLRNTRISIQVLEQLEQIILNHNFSYLNLSGYYKKDELLKLFQMLSRQNLIEYLILQKFFQQDIKNQDQIKSYFQKLSKIKVSRIHIQYKKGIKVFIEKLKFNKFIRQLQISGDFPFSEFKSFIPFLVQSHLLVLRCKYQLPQQLLLHFSQKGKIVNESLKIITLQQIIQSQIPSSRNIEKDFWSIGCSLDGGGSRGLILATMLNQLQNHVRYQPWQIFSCIGGTSIGGILSLGAAGTLDGLKPIYSTEQMIKIFHTQSQKIYNQNAKIGLIYNIFDKSKYSKDGIQQVCNKYFKDSKLSDVLPRTNVVVTAVKRQNFRKNQAKIFRSRQAILNDKKNFYMKDVARATSAAPTYFPSAQIKNIQGSKQYSLIDGGVGLNNPSKLVLDDIKKQAFNFNNEKKFFLVSIGTGKLQSQKQISQNAGIFNIFPIIDAFSDCANDYIQKCISFLLELRNQYQGHYIRANPIINIFKQNVQLDNYDSKILQIYSKIAIQKSQKLFIQSEEFGPYKDRSLVEWLKENTNRKKQMI